MSGRAIEEMTLAELRAEARRREIPGAGRMKKQELRAALQRPASAGARERAPEIDWQGVLDRLRGVPWSRWLGGLIRAAGAAGAVASLALVLALPFAARGAASSAQQALAGAAGLLQSTSQSLGLARDSVQRAAGVLRGASESLEGLEGSLQQTEPLINSVGVLVGERAPETIEETRQALEAAVPGAQAIDQVLRALSLLSPLTGVDYSPEEPLDESLSDTASTLRPLPATLRQVRSELDSASGELREIRTDLRSVATDLADFSASLVRLEGDLGAKEQYLASQANALEAARTRAPGWAGIASAVVGLGLVWVGLGQCAVFVVGHQLRSGTAGSSAELRPPTRRAPVRRP